AAHPSAGSARHLAEQGDDGQVPRGDEEVLLRSVALQDLSRSARHQVSDRASSQLLNSATPNAQVTPNAQGPKGPKKEAKGKKEERKKKKRKSRRQGLGVLFRFAAPFLTRVAMISFSSSVSWITGSYSGPR